MSMKALTKIEIPECVFDLEAGQVYGVTSAVFYLISPLLGCHIGLKWEVFPLEMHRNHPIAAPPLLGCCHYRCECAHCPAPTPAPTPSICSQPVNKWLTYRCQHKHVSSLNKWRPLLAFWPTVTDNFHIQLHTAARTHVSVHGSHLMFRRSHTDVAVCGSAYASNTYYSIPALIFCVFLPKTNQRSTNLYLVKGHNAANQSCMSSLLNQPGLLDENPSYVWVKRILQTCTINILQTASDSGISVLHLPSHSLSGCSIDLPWNCLSYMLETPTRSVSRRLSRNVRVMRGSECNTQRFVHLRVPEQALFRQLPDEPEQEEKGWASHDFEPLCHLWRVWGIFMSFPLRQHAKIWARWQITELRLHSQGFYFFVCTEANSHSCNIPSIMISLEGDEW